MRRLLYLLTGLLALPAPAVSAGADPAAGPAPARLADHLEAAWQRHPQARASAARLDAAAASEDLSGRITPGPGAVSLGGRTDRPWDNAGKREVEVEYSVPLWLPGQWDAARDAARRGRVRVQADTAALRLELAGELRQAWGAVVTSRDALGLARRRLDTAGQLDADVARRLRAGEVSRLDANLAAHETVAARAAVLDAESALAEAQQAWQALTGGPPPLRLEDETVAEMPGHEPVPPRREDEVAPAGRPGGDAAPPPGSPGEDVAAAAPDVHHRLRALRGTFEERYGRTLGVSLRIPLSSEPRQREATAAATADLLQAEAELARARARLDLDLGRARRELAAAESQLALAGSRQGLAADNLQLADKAYRLGELDLPALLRARALAFEADADAARSRNAMRQARARLNQTLGVLP
ncbi:MAG: TolC family protein [Betaproteobacteria bacterium]|nr:TolC family protein [Betaproteobacteria bacterium]